MLGIASSEFLVLIKGGLEMTVLYRFKVEGGTTQVDRLKGDRLKEKTCAITQSQDRLDTLAGDWVMDDHYCPSVFSLNT